MLLATLNLQETTAAKFIIHHFCLLLAVAFRTEKEEEMRQREREREKREIRRRHRKGSRMKVARREGWQER